MRRMRVFLLIGMSMVQPVHDPIGPGTHIRSTMGDIGTELEKFLPAFGHAAKAMGSITMIEERLKKQ
jgi:hypothetical protein